MDISSNLFHSNISDKLNNKKYREQDSKNNPWIEYNRTYILVFLWGFTIFTWTLILYLIYQRNKKALVEKNYIIYFLLCIPYLYILTGIVMDLQLTLSKDKKAILPPLWPRCFYLPEKKDDFIAKYDYECAFDQFTTTINNSANLANKSYYLIYVLMLLMIIAQQSKRYTLLDNKLLLSFSTVALLLIFMTSGLMTLNTQGLYSMWIIQYMKSILCMTGICIMCIIYLYFKE